MRELDRRTIEEHGTPGEVLMERAGAGVAEELLAFAASLPAIHARRFVILAGKGNNGGDAYVVARHLLTRSSTPVVLYATCSVDALTGDAKTHATRLPASVPVIVKQQLASHDFQRGDIIVDGLLGTGSAGAPRPPYDQWIAAVNAAALPVVAIDLPSGLDGDTGAVASVAVKADLTVTIGLPKTGLFLGDGPEICGRLRVVKIGIPDEYVEGIPAPKEAFFADDARTLLGRRPMECHKNSVGRVVVVGGSARYPGAPQLAGAAAMRSGAGFVTIAIPAATPEIGRPLLALVVRKIADEDKGHFCATSLTEISELFDTADAAVIGPGMTNCDDCANLLPRLLACNLPMAVDADALNTVACNPAAFPADRSRLVLTPHPGEAKRLIKGFGLDHHLEADRLTQAKELATKTRAVIVLKGHQTIVASPDGRISINTSGCPALAKAGSGDVLSGVVAAYLAAGLPPFDAARLGVFVHGLAGELATTGSRGLAPDDLPGLLPAAVMSVSPFG